MAKRTRRRSRAMQRRAFLLRLDCQTAAPCATIDICRRVVGDWQRLVRLDPVKAIYGPGSHKLPCHSWGSEIHGFAVEL